MTGGRTARYVLIALLAVALLGPGLAGCIGQDGSPAAANGTADGTGDEASNGNDGPAAANGTTDDIGDGAPNGNDGPAAANGSTGGEATDDAPATATVSEGGRELATLELAVADSMQERHVGLMHRETVPRDGMLFVYLTEDEQNFWMKNTQVPLDMIFVDANGTVVHVAHASVPDPGTPDGELRNYGGVEAKYVIEVERGVANRTGIGSGATVAFSGDASVRR